MYLFSRTRRVRPGRAWAAIAAAVDAGGRVQQITGVEVHLWATVMSPEVGRVVWTTAVEHLDEIGVANGKLAAETTFGDFVESVDDLFEGPLDDGLYQIVHGEAPSTPSAYAQVVTAVCANGSVASGIAGGIELAQRATEITGLPVLFCVGQTGPYGGVMWVSGGPDLATVEQGGAAIAADPSWPALIDRVGPSYGGAATTTLYQRLV